VISHEYRVIFIHIPRTGGTTIEEMFTGKDWWFFEPKQKHLSAGEARKIYAEWWDSYFKFSIVRNPFDRVASRYMSRNYGFEVNGATGHSMNFFLDNYKTPTWEKDPGTCTQYLDESLDLIIRFEDYANELAKLVRSFGLEHVSDDLSCRCCSRRFHAEKTYRKHYREYFDQNSRERVEALYREDLERFEYGF
jgi:hypothetical protein